MAGFLMRPGQAASTTGSVIGDSILLLSPHAHRQGVTPILNMMNV